MHRIFFFITFSDEFFTYEEQAQDFHFISHICISTNFRLFWGASDILDRVYVKFNCAAYCSSSNKQKIEEKNVDRAQIEFLAIFRY